MGRPDQEGRVSDFRQSLTEVQPLRLREPLAGLLGAITDDQVIEYSYTDAVKLAGHACPTVTGAWLVCREALKALYPDGELPVRGEISVTVYGAPDEAVYGVMSQVIGLITGAAPATGFKGLGGSFVRQDLISFDPGKPDPAAISFRFTRTDSGRTVLVKFFPWAIPFPEEKGKRAGELMEQVLGGAASPAEVSEFQDLWMEKIEWMLSQENTAPWLLIAEG